MTLQTTDAPSGLTVRYTEPGDAPYLKQWLLDPEAAHGFPMADELEVEDSVVRWIAFSRFKCSLTVLKDGVPCGIATLFLQPYKRLIHQCEFGIIVGSGYRNMGVGSFLLNALLHLAKEKFHIELIHLHVFEGNPANRLYERFGFKVFGRQEGWGKTATGEPRTRLFMQRKL